MKRIATTLLGLLTAVFFATPLLAQETGDYRTRDSGNWSNAQIWQRYNGSTWAAVATPPTGAETTITVQAADSVFVDAAATVTGLLVNQGIVEANDMLTIGDGGVYDHAQDGGEIPRATWAEGSTLTLTGVVGTAPEERNQNYHHIVFDSPGLSSNLNMSLDSVTVSGDIRVVNTGPGTNRWYLTSTTSGEGTIVTILGDVFVESGNFSVQGTSNPNTTFVVDHYGDVVVTGGNFSIARGSQGGTGTTTWNLHGGDFTMSNATTQNSNSVPGNARFVFTGQERQTLTLGEGNTISSLPIEVAGGATLDVGTSVLAGSGTFTVRADATLATAHPGGVAAIFDATFEGVVTLEDDASFAFNGAEAQVTSDLMPAVVADLVIDNAAGVALSQPTTINGTLRLLAGVFDNTVPFTLGAGGTISLEGGSLLLDTADEDEGELPRSFTVEQNYPNPFNPSTVIRYGLPVASEVTVRVYNALGQEVLAAPLGHKAAGVHTFTLDAGDLGSGVYIYRVESAGQAVSKRMVVIK